MEETFREWIRKNHSRKELDHATKYHHSNHNMLEDFILCCEEEVMEWVAEQCNIVLKGMDEE